jgi:hypothetical protein
MGSKKRLALALVIILSGLLLVPFVALPKESFRWQLFAGAYGAAPIIDSNYGTGAPGSAFLIAGFGFTPKTTLTLKSNGVTIGTVVTDANGGFRITVVTPGNGLGRYVVTAEETGKAASLAAVSPALVLQLVAEAPVRAAEAGVTQLQLPNNPANLSPERWLPFVAR